MNELAALHAYRCLHYMHNCQILTGRNIYNSYPLKIFTVWLIVFVIRFCLSILFFLSSQHLFVYTFEIASLSKSRALTIS